MNGSFQPEEIRAPRSRPEMALRRAAPAIPGLRKPGSLQGLFQLPKITLYQDKGERNLSFSFFRLGLFFKNTTKI
ncbi:MAG: hypothetical protein IIA14_00295 [SAR324 cluster bacterium]|nr:hypothetical protein [SAR324 cluster bacterium]